MRQLKRSECSVLTLVLKRKWYDMIASGEKKEEYRESKRHWWSRIDNWLNNLQPCRYDGTHDDGNVVWADFVVHRQMVAAFSLGYKKADMFFVVDSVIGPNSKHSEHAPHPEWGEPDDPHYVIRLGERVELVD